MTEPEEKKSKYLKPILGLVIGAAIGFGYYYIVGCVTGACPITSNPYLMTGAGAFFGFGFSKK